MEIEAYKYILVLKIQHLIWIKNYAWKQQLSSKKMQQHLWGLVSTVTYLTSVNKENIVWCTKIFISLAFP